MVSVECPNNSDLVFCREHRPGESRLPSSPKQPPSRTWAGWASGIRAGERAQRERRSQSFEFVKSSTVPSHVLGSFSSRMPPPRQSWSNRRRLRLIPVYFGPFIIRLELVLTELERINNNNIRNEDKYNRIKIIHLRILFSATRILWNYGKLRWDFLKSSDLFNFQDQLLKSSNFFFSSPIILYSFLSSRRIIKD